jgi:hypothetical protein
VAATIVTGRPRLIFVAYGDQRLSRVKGYGRNWNEARPTGYDGGCHSTSSRRSVSSRNSLSAKHSGNARLRCDGLATGIILPDNEFLLLTDLRDDDRAVFVAYGDQRLSRVKGYGLWVRKVVWQQC